MDAINQASEYDLTKDGRCIEQRHRDCASYRRKAKRASIGRKIDVWDEETQTLKYIACLEYPECGGF